MPGEDNLSSRFDYLFEPIDDEESADGTGDAESASADDDPPRTGAPVMMAFASFVLGTLAAVAAVAVLLLQRPYAPTKPVSVPLESAPQPTTVPDMPPQLGPPPPPEPAPSQTATEAPQTVESSPQPQTAPQPTTSQRERETHVTNSPTTREPISVAPETRPPFPKQGPQQGDPKEGDLIPGVGLPGAL
jgi:hypothetical protein